MNPFRFLALLTLLLLGAAGCAEKADIQKDAMDERSLKALENPPPGMPGVAPKAAAPAPAGGKQAPPGSPAQIQGALQDPGAAPPK